MPFKCICIDDEPLAREGLALALSKYQKFELLRQFQSGQEALSQKLQNIDVMFVDIEMPGMTGLELVRNWPEPMPKVVFVTAYDQYALEAFEHDALDYILKPIDESQFERVINKLQSHLQQLPHVQDKEELIAKLQRLQQSRGEEQEQISLKTDEGYFRVYTKDVLWLESVNDHVCVHLSDRHLIVRGTLKQFLSELVQFGFEQIHRCHIVNPEHVKQISKARFSDYVVTLSDKTELRMSRRYKNLLTKVALK